MRALCVSIHDVAPATWPLCCKLVDAIAEVDASLPITLLVVPDYHGEGMATPQHYAHWIDARLARGDEVAAHGLRHLDEASPSRLPLGRLRRRFYTAGEGEFASLSYAEARRRIDVARTWFDAHGWPVRGFVAPAWLLSAGTWRALADTGFTYTTTFGGFHLLRKGAVVRAPTVVYSTRTPWRRRLSRRWNDALADATARARVVRFSLHPEDARYPTVLHHAQGVLERMRRDRVALTKGAFAERAETLFA